MTIRWRILVLLVQLVVLISLSYAATGEFLSSATWFIAGLLAIAINPQLLEPHYRRPADVVANSLIFLFIYGTVQKTITAPGWNFFAIIFSFLLILALASLLLGSRKGEGKSQSFAQAARRLSQLGSARLIYSAVFILAAIEFAPTLRREFWLLIGGWFLIVAIGYVNWQAVWSSASGRVATATAEGMIGPSSVLVTAPILPSPGSWVELHGRVASAQGVVISRVRRPTDTWGQIHVASQSDCEAILLGETLTVTNLDEQPRDLVGSVDAGSTDRSLHFTATHPLEVGEVVVVTNFEPKMDVIYQLSKGEIHRLDIRGGSHLEVRARANQLGVVDTKTAEFRRYRWVPSPGAPVWSGAILKPEHSEPSKEDSILLGHVIGTKVPIFLDCGEACDGHLAILGMTKMGKSTLAERLAQKLAKSRRVTILDQTGEYVSKKHLPPCGMDVDWQTPGISVFEPKPGEVPAKRAHDFLKYLVQQALEEYKSGSPISRSVVIDEAHQFIPEPAGLGFGAPGRENSYAIGLLMMQIRKYGISIVLISQRTAVVAKSALSQCENLIAFRSVDQTGLDYLEAIAGSDIRNLLPQLRQGEALVFGPAMSSDSAVAIQVVRPEADPEST